MVKSWKGAVFTSEVVFVFVGEFSTFADPSPCGVYLAFYLGGCYVCDLCIEFIVAKVLECQVVVRILGDYAKLLSLIRGQVN